MEEARGHRAEEDFASIHIARLTAHHADLRSGPQTGVCEQGHEAQAGDLPSGGDLAGCAGVGRGALSCLPAPQRLAHRGRVNAEDEADVLKRKRATAGLSRDPPLRVAKETAPGGVTCPVVLLARARHAAQA